MYTHRLKKQVLKDEDGSTYSGIKFEIIDGWKVIGKSGYIDWYDDDHDEIVAKLALDNTILGISVDKDQWNKHIGTELLMLVMGDAKSKGYGKFLIEGATKNARTFYEKALGRFEDSNIINSFSSYPREDCDDFVYWVYL